MKKTYMFTILIVILFLIGQITAQTSENQTEEVSNLEDLNSWRIYSSGNIIRDMAVENQLVWAATTGGAVSWNIEDGTYHKYTVKDGLPDNNILAMAIDGDGNKWFGTRGGGVARFGNAIWTTFTEADGLGNNDVMMGIAAQGADVWVTAEETGISHFNGSTWEVYTESDGLIDNNTRDVAIDQSGNVWIGTSGGVSKFDGSSWTNYTEADGLAHNVINGVAVDESNNIWFCTWGGVSKLTGTHWTTYTTSNGLISDFCIDIYADYEVWVGTNYGLSQHSQGNWRSFTTDHGLVDNNIYALTRAQDDGMWFGTWSYGISEFKEEQWITHTTDDALPNNDIYSIFVDDHGVKWFATGGGLSSFNGAQWQTYTKDDSSHYWVRDLAPDSNGNLWLAGANATMLDGQHIHYIDNPHMAYDAYTAVAVRNNDSIWFGTWNDGVAHFTGTVWNMITQTDGLVSNQVNALAIDQLGNVWIGTSNGLTIWREGDSWITYTIADGLISNNVNRIRMDNAGNMWVMGGGVSKINPAGEITAVGLADRSVNDVSFDSLGNPWFATNKGVSHFNGSTWTHYTPANGISSNNALSIVMEGPWKVWVGTWGGITEFYRGVYLPVIVKQ